MPGITPSSWDYLIIGQGLAGTCLAHTLLEAGQSVLVADDGHRGAASVHAVGSFHPVVFKRLTVKWRAEEMLDLADHFYTSLGQRLGLDLIDRFPLLKVFANPQDVDVWQEKAQHALSWVLDENVLAPDAIAELNMPEGGGWVTRAGRLRMEQLLPAFRSWLKDRDLLIEEAVQSEDLERVPDGFRWKNQHFRQVVFCEGQRLRENPWFNWLPLRPAKGEYLTIRISGEPFKHSTNRGFMMVPMTPEVYWIGSTFSWDQLDEEPTAEGREELLAKVKKVLRVPFEVISQGAGIRPATKDRRAMVGVHPEDSCVALLNGFGARGVMIAPFLAHQLRDCLLHDAPIDPEVDLMRYYADFERSKEQRQ